MRESLEGTTSATLPGRGLFLWAYDPSRFSMPTYDVARARRLLDTAGWRTNASGTRVRNGKPLTLTLMLRNDKPSAEIGATIMQRMLAAVGIIVNVRTYPIVELVAPADEGGPLYGGSFSLAYFQYLSGFDPDLRDQFACDRIPPRGFNKSRYCNPHLDALMTQAARTFDRSERRALYAQAQAILARDLPIVPLYQATSMNAYPRGLRGERTGLTSAFWNVDRWQYRAQ